MQENLFTFNEKPILLKENSNQSSLSCPSVKLDVPNIFDNMENQIKIDFQPIPIHELLAKFKDLECDTPTKCYDRKSEENSSVDKSETDSTEGILNRTIIEDTSNVDSNENTNTPVSKQSAAKKFYTNELNKNIDMKIEIRDIFKSTAKTREYSKVGRSQTVGSHDYVNKAEFDNPFSFLNHKNSSRKLKTPKCEPVPIKSTPKPSQSSRHLSYSVSKKKPSVLKENNRNILNEKNMKENNVIIKENNVIMKENNVVDELKIDKSNDKPVNIQFLLPSKHQRSLSKQFDATRSTNGYKTPLKPHVLRVENSKKNIETPLKNGNGELKCDSKFRTILVKGKEYIVINKLGEGGSCQVFDCLDPISLEHRAIKIVNLAVDEITAKGYINEVKMLKTLQGNECVITMYDFEITKSTLFVIMEKGGIDLLTFLRKIVQKSSRLPIHVINYYWIEMLNCVKEIHDAGIIHSDLKPSNFLIVDGRLKLIDFGIASRMSADMTSVIKNVQVGTFNYISPEALLDSRGNSESPNDGRPRIRISYKSDVWSLGCILYQMVYQRTPFHNIGNTFAKVSMIVDPSHVIEYPHVDGIPQECIETLKKCLQYDMKRRPTVTELGHFARIPQSSSLQNELHYGSITLLVHHSVLQSYH